MERQGRLVTANPAGLRRYSWDRSLAVAATKSLYQRLFWSDITARLDVPEAHYAGVVSSGTFTLAHVGPAALDEVLRITWPGGLVVISINVRHYEQADR